MSNCENNVVINNRFRCIRDVCVFGSYRNTFRGISGNSCGLPLIENIAVENITSTTATIVWDTTMPATSQIDYGFAEDNYDFSVQDNTPVTHHVINLTELTPGTTYYFQVVSTDNENYNTVMSLCYTFTTLQSKRGFILSQSAPFDKAELTIENLQGDNNTENVASDNYQNRDATNDVLVTDGGAGDNEGAERAGETSDADKKTLDTAKQEQTEFINVAIVSLVVLTACLCALLMKTKIF